MTYALISSNREDLGNRTRPFAAAFEPVLAALEDGRRHGHPAAAIPQVGEYLDVCRWPFRRLEYSFVLDAIDRIGPAPLACLDVGCGATGLPHVLAKRGHTVQACDYDRHLIGELTNRRVCDLLATTVGYTFQDATALQFASDTFDVVACVSVLEHIPAPHDLRAVDEMIRVLKPGGLFVLTIDYSPTSATSQGRRQHYLERAQRIVATEGVAGLVRAFRRKRAASADAASAGGAVPRSANQPFDWRHLEQDLLPRLAAAGMTPVSVAGAPAGVDPRTVDGVAARAFWDLEPGLFERQGRRAIVPVGLAMRKPR